MSKLRRRLEALENMRVKSKQYLPWLSVVDPQTGVPYMPVPVWANVVVFIPDNGRGDCTLPSMPR